MAKKNNYIFTEYDSKDDTNIQMLVRMPKTHFDFLQRMKSAGVCRSNQDAVIKCIEHMVTKYPELDFA